MKAHSIFNSIATFFLATFLASGVTAADTVGAADSARIIVSGEGSASLPPDMATLQLTVTRDAATAREAMSANSQAMSDVITAMKRAGIAERDLQTAGINIQPRYSYPQRNNPEETRKLLGYTVRNTLTVRVRDLDTVGEVLDQAVSLGVNEGGGISFGNADPANALSEARARAVQSAQTKAAELAAAAGVKLGAVMELSEGFSVAHPAPKMRTEMAMASDARSVPVERGENTYQVRVQVIYAIAR